MSSFRNLVLSLIVFATLAGCHCTPISERYNDHIDNIADTSCRSEQHYCPRLDVTRWGMWNGPACCRDKCCQRWVHRR